MATENNNNEVQKSADDGEEEKTVESLCSDCVRELENEAIENVIEIKQEPSLHINSEINDFFAEGLDEVEALSQAMSTLSQLSIDCPFVDINFETESVKVFSGDTKINVNNEINRTNAVEINKQSEINFVIKENESTNIVNINKENAKNMSSERQNIDQIKNQNGDVKFNVKNVTKKNGFNGDKADNISVNNFDEEFDRQLEKQFENFHEEFDQQLEQFQNFDKEFNENFAFDKQEFSDKAIQTNGVSISAYKNQPGPEFWDPEFPTVAELEKIDTVINKEPISENPRSSKCKRKLSFDDHNQPKMAKKSKEVKKPDVNAISSVKINREKQFLGLSNDLFELSSHLDAVKKAMNSKQSFASLKNLSPPTLSGYDTQFDSVLHQNRFTKLPIKVGTANINNNNSKTKDLNEPVNQKPRVKVLTNKNFNSKPKHAKGNDRNIKIVGKSYHQSTIEEAFNSGKENKSKSQESKIRNQENKVQNGFKELTPSINHNIHNFSSNVASLHSSDGKSYDSTLMDDYNPLRNLKSSVPTKKK